MLKRNTLDQPLLLMVLCTSILNLKKQAIEHSCQVGCPINIYVEI